MLKARAVEHRYRGVTVLQAPDFELAPDEHCALIGASGAGKSTLLHILAGILPPAAGRVQLDDDDLYPRGGRDDRWRARRIGVVPQKLHLIAALTARENVALAAQLAGADVAAAVSGLDTLGLAARADARPGELSLGEQQRVAIARALAARPRLLLADEPTSSLDDDNAQAVIELLLDAARRAGALLVVATHDARIRGRLARTLEVKRPQ
jgi:putative ABC transport system ATP-binding protein